MLTKRIISSICDSKDSHNEYADSQPSHGTNEMKLKAQPTVLESRDGVTSDDITTGSAGTGGNPFSDPDVAERYRQVYDKAHYECRHLFDPELTWTEEEERRLVKRTDWRVCLWAVRPR